MINFFSIARRVVRVSRPVPLVHFLRLLLLALLLAGPSPGRAQAPAWQLAVSGNGSQASAGSSFALASAADAAGNVFVTGFFSSAVMFGSTRLVSVGGEDVFVAKWDVTAQAFTWATSGGGTGDDRGQGIAVSGTGVLVAGYFESGSNARLAGQALAGAGLADVFVAKYLDTSTGHTPATSSFANAWATSGGGTGRDYGRGIAGRGAGVFVTGSFDSSGNASIAGRTLPGTGGMFVAKYLDTSTGNTPATSSFANGWATSGGSLTTGVGYGIAVSGPAVYVTGSFTSGSNTIIAGQALAGAGNIDSFVAKYVDTSTGNTPATSSFANGWATSGGGTGSDESYGIAVRGTNVYVIGSYESGSNARFAGQALAGAGSLDAFVAKYVDTSTGNTPATSSFANAWATSAGGTGYDVGEGIAVSGPNVLVTGYFDSGSNASIAGQALAGVGSVDAFVAKYVDTSTGSTPTTSSFADAWATSAGGISSDYGISLSISGQQVYTIGTISPPATFGSITISAAGGGISNFLARLTDLALPLAVQPATPAGTGLALFPNPAPGGTATLRGPAPGTSVQVLDALGRVVATATADAAGTAALPTGLRPGVYVVRGGGRTTRLVVE